MAHNSERRMNLGALQRVDANIVQIIDNASQVALYKFNQRSTEWEKTEIEGTFFIFLRTISPENGFIVMNRLSTTNLVEPITSELEFQLQSPFLLYKNSTGQIYGIWFYDETECLRIEVVLNRLAQSAVSDSKLKSTSHRQRCASEGDQTLKSLAENKAKGSMDILSLLCQAQEEYDKQQQFSRSSEALEPKRISEKPPSNPTLHPVKTEIIKPTPLRLTNGLSSPGDQNITKPNTPNKGTALSLAALFAQANATQHREISPLIQSGELAKLNVFSPSQGAISGAFSKPTDLQRLLSNPANTVEHIEKQQLNENTNTNAHRERATSCSTGIDFFTSAENLEKDIKEKLKLNMKPNEQQAANLYALPVSSLPNENDLFSLNSRRQSVIPGMAPITSSAFQHNSSDNHSETPILTPAMLEQGIEANAILTPGYDRDMAFFNTVSTNPNKLPLFPKISPITFTQSLSTVVQRPNQSNDGINNSINKVNGNDLLLPQQLESDIKTNNVLALTKEHLKESLVYLLQNDDDFLGKVHEGYIASLKSQLTRFNFKS